MNTNFGASEVETTARLCPQGHGNDARISRDIKSASYFLQRSRQGLERHQCKTSGRL